MSFKENLVKGKRWLNIACNQFKLLKEKNRRPLSDSPTGVIIVKIDAIGDFIIWLDSASQYPLIYKDEPITLVCNKLCEQIAKHTGLFDKVIAVDSRRFEADNKYKKEVLKELEKQQNRVLIQPVFSRTIDMDLISYRIPAKEKIAFKADESRMNLSRYMAISSVKKCADSVYDKLIDATDGWVMEAKRNAEFIRGLGTDFKAGYSDLPEYNVKEGVIPDKPYVVIFPGSSSTKKMWPVNNFAVIIEYIVEKWDREIYICGSKGESWIAEDIIKCITNSDAKNKTHNYCGKTTLLELAEVIRHAMYMVSNDTSGIHFAAAVNTKGICLFGEFAYGRFLPYDIERHDKHNEIYVCSAGMKCKRCSAGKITAECKANLMNTGRYLCIDKISVDNVKLAVNKAEGVTE